MMEPFDDKTTINDARSAIAIDGHISYGQSWRSNAFTDFKSFGLNPQGPLAFLIPSIGAFLGPGPLPNSAGINLSSLPSGVTNYKGSDIFSIGRCVPLTIQLLRIRDNQTSLQPILEFCSAFPGSTWNSGLGGGLAPGAQFVGSISGTTLTVESITGGYDIAGGQMIVAPGVNVHTRIYANLTLTRSLDEYNHLLEDNDGVNIDQLVSGGVGTYSLNIDYTSLEATFFGTNPAAQFIATASYGVMTVTSITSGSLAVNQFISGGSIPVGTIITQQISGTTGGLGQYVLALPQTVASEAMVANGISWTNLVKILSKVPNGSGVFPTKQYSQLLISSFGYTQGGSSDGTSNGKVSDLIEMMQEFDKLNLNIFLRGYFGLPAGISNSTVAADSTNGTIVFCRTHYPGGSATYSNRVYATGPSYPYQFNGADNIHTGDYGSSRWGEIEGYVRWLVQDKKIPWTPLWRPLSNVAGSAITRSGNTIIIPFARPSGPDFANRVMSFQNNADDGIMEWPQKGFHVKRNGIELPLVTNPVISGMNVILDIGQPTLIGDEVRYCWYGPGSGNPSTMTGVGGNLVMTGPPSVLYPNGWHGVPKTIDAWAWPFIENVVV